MRQAERDLDPTGALDEASPWLKRTGWRTYLHGCSQEDLINSIAEPSRLPETMTTEKNREMDYMIWNGVKDLVRIVQKTTASCGQCILSVATQTQLDSEIRTTMEVYQNEFAVVVEARPWQQILMFFLRTQRKHTWNSPEYHFEMEQQISYKEMVDAATSEMDGSEDDRIPEEGCLSPLQVAILRFCIELLSQRDEESKWELPLVCASAVLGVKTKVETAGRTWQTPETYLPTLSHILKVSRMMVIQCGEELSRLYGADDTSALEDGEDDPFALEGTEFTRDFIDRPFENREETILVSDAQIIRTEQTDNPWCRSPYSWKRRRLDRFHSRQVDTTSLMSLVQQLTNDFMVRGTRSPAHCFLDEIAYGLSIRLEMMAIGPVDWRDRETLRYRTMTFTTSAFRSMIHTLVNATKQQLFEDVLLTSPDQYASIPSIPWHRIYDYVSNTPGINCFLDDPRTKLPKQGENWLLTRMKQQGQFMRRGNMHKPRLLDWLQATSRFRTKLLVLMHMTGGLPVGGPDILGLRYKNSLHGVLRNVFIEGGLVVFVIQYQRHYTNSYECKTIHRYLPRDVGALVVWYLWLVTPVVQLGIVIFSQELKPLEHLWQIGLEERKWTTARLSDEIKMVCREGLGNSEEIDFAAYRDIAIALSGPYDQYSAVVETDLEDRAIDVEMQPLIYLEDGMTPDMRGFHRKIAHRKDLCYKASLAWHAFLGFKPKECIYDDEDTSSVAASTIRESIVRKNIVYKVLNYARKSSKERLEALQYQVGGVLSRDKAASRQGKIVIICESIDHVNQIIDAKLFPCTEHVWESRASEKEASLKRFLAGKVQVLVANGAFGLTLDIPDIRLVIHFDDPRSILEYTQASALGGRDGKKFQSIILLGGLTFHKDSKLLEYLQEPSPTCRRIILNEYRTDNRTRSGCVSEDGEEFCDVCDSRRRQEMVESVHEEDEFWPGTAHLCSKGSEDEEHGVRQASPPREETTLGNRYAAAYLQFQIKLDAWKGKCAICHSENLEYGHSLSKCNNQSSKRARVESRVIQGSRGITYDSELWYICTDCGVPREMCHQYDRDSDYILPWCQNDGILVETVVAVKYGFPELWNAVVWRAGVSDLELKGLMRWLGSRAGPWETNLIRVYLELTERMADKVAI